MTEETAPVAETKSFLKDKFNSTKTFVKKHRVALAVTATSIAWSALMVKSAGSFNEFLEENPDLSERYDSLKTDMDAAQKAQIESKS